MHLPGTLWIFTVAVVIVIASCKREVATREPSPNTAGHPALVRSLDASSPTSPDATAVVAGLEGLVIYEDRRALRWIDLASGQTGELAYRGPMPGIVVEDARAVWFDEVSAAGSISPVGALRVERAGSSVAAKLVPNIRIPSVSPDGTRAIVNCLPAGTVSPVCEATVTGSTISMGAQIYEPLYAIDRWLSNDAVIAHEEEVKAVRVFRLEFGKPAVMVTKLGEDDRPYVSHDGSILAALPRDGDDNRKLRFRSLAKPRTAARSVKVGAGAVMGCAFSRDDRWFICSFDRRVDLTIAIEVSTGTQKVLLDSATGGFVFSPDGRSILLTEGVEHQFVIVPLDGQGDLVRLPVKGEPHAWLR